MCSNTLGLSSKTNNKQKTESLLCEESQLKSGGPWVQSPAPQKKKGKKTVSLSSHTVSTIKQPHNRWECGCLC
jgi:hypothetical protein